MTKDEAFKLLQSSIATKKLAVDELNNIIKKTRKIKTIKSCFTCHYRQDTLMGYNASRRAFTYCKAPEILGFAISSEKVHINESCGIYKKEIKKEK